MATKYYNLRTDFSDGETPYTGAEFSYLHETIDSQLNLALQAIGGGVLPRPDLTSLQVSAGAGLSVTIAPGLCIIPHPSFGNVAAKKETAQTLSGLTPNSTLYVFAAVENSISNKTQQSGIPLLTTAIMGTVPGALPLAQVITGPAGVITINDLRDFIEFGGGDNSEQWHTGTGAPSAGLGEDGDFYINSTNGDYYEKVAGAWVARANLKGPQGDQGPQGEQGPAGADGGVVSALVADEVTVTTGVLAPGASETVTITLGKTARLSRVTSTHPAWMRLYPSVAAKNADSTRNIDEWFTGDELVFDVLTRDGDLSDSLGGGLDAASIESPRVSTYPLVVGNTGLTSAAISVTIRRIILEN